MIEYLKKINTENYFWCDDAALIRVTGGKSALRAVSSEADYDTYTFRSVLMLNGKPLVQGEYPGCPTCTALLARGYGIENINCPELQAVRDNVNSEFHNIETAIDNIKPVLDLLDNGFYLIADTKLYPTDAGDHYFANVPYKLSEHIASCDGFYNPEFTTVVNGFPAYIYPTQSNSVLDINRADYYFNLIDKPDAPRAIAYYDSGFVCALLDGHHKAYAAAQKGCMLPALVIIPMSGVYKYTNNFEEKAVFSEIHIPVSELPGFKGITPQAKQEIYFDDYHNDPVDESRLNLTLYPAIDELTGIIAAGAESLTITEELIKNWIESGDYSIHEKLHCVTKYYAKKSPGLAYMIAKTVVSLTDGNSLFNYLLKLSYHIIVNNKCEESEKLVTDYLVNHDNQSPAYDICCSYWDDCSKE